MTKESNNPTQDRARLIPAHPPPPMDKLYRLTWMFVQATLYRWSPIPLHAWRRGLLRLFGAHIEAGVHVYPDARIWAPWNLVMRKESCLGPRSICYSAASVHLGEYSVVSQGAHLCAATHDHRDRDFTLLIGPIEVQCNAWVAADAFVGPGVTIEKGAVVGARAVTLRNVAAGTVVVGNPAKIVSCR